MNNLQDWFAAPLGKRLLDKEKRLLHHLLSPLFGYHLLQLGSMGEVHWLDNSRIKHRCIINTTPTGNCHLYAKAEALPIASDSIDVIIVGHVLEFSPHPHTVLREVERILIAEGHLILLAFNPLSLWGLRQIMPGGTLPWRGHFRTALRIKDWLALLGFELIEQHGLFFAPPVHTSFLQRHLAFLEHVGQRWWPHLGGVYVLVAKKRVATLTPIKPRWMRTQSVLATVRPSARSDPTVHHERGHEDE
jgi:SAM-dependent methyltransferase